MNASPARSTAERNTLASSAVTAARSTGSKRASIRPACEPGEVEQGVDQLAQPQGVALDDLELLARPRVRLDRGRGRSSATGPMISVSGVRNSWLTLEKKSVFARSSSASASARRRSAS